MRIKKEYNVKIMRLHRFIGNFDLSQKQIVINDADFINQIRNVLRFKIGGELILCDGKMNEAHARFTELGSSVSKLEVLKVYKNETEPENYVVLYCPILKKENFEWTVQKAVEVGVKEITPIITTRTVKLGLNYERLNKIIKEAAEQSSRGVLPKLNETINFNEAVSETKNKNEINLFFNIGESPLGSRTFKFNKIGVFVGPEGGWTEEEISTVAALEIPSLTPNENKFSLDGSLGIIKKAQSNDFTLVGLGNTVLRAETAAIIASYLTANLC